LKFIIIHIKDDQFISCSHSFLPTSQIQKLYKP
jgi:hypothetical protein